MTEDSPNNAQISSQRPGRLGRFLRALFKTLLILIFLAALVGLASAGWWGYSDLQRSRVMASGRIDSQAEQLKQLTEQLLQLEEQLTEQDKRVGAMRESGTGQDEYLAGLEADLGDSLAHQDEMLADVTIQISGMISETQAMTQNIDLLNEGQIVLQQDLIKHGSELDTLGGELDGVAGELTTLQANGDSLAEELALFEAQLTEADPGALRQAVGVFRVWELVTRARLRLAEQNSGLALADVELAQAALSDLLAFAPEPLVQPLQQVERRLLLAAGNLPDVPELAVNDLDTAWQELDGVLTIIMGGEVTPAATATP